MNIHLLLHKETVLSLASGEWRVASGEWRVASGEWRVASGEWRVASGEWRVASLPQLHPTSTHLTSKNGTV
ncbi:MAG: hypothetical protein KIT50_18110 [Bacteroidetes bacterium]|nr:hypothetical protein [Bacteroidota bacterium]